MYEGARCSGLESPTAPGGGVKGSLITGYEFRMTSFFRPLP